MQLNITQVKDMIFNNHVYFVYEDDNEFGYDEPLLEFADLLAKLNEKKIFKAKFKDVYIEKQFLDSSLESTIFIGLGKRSEFDMAKLRKVIGILYKTIKDNKLESIDICIHNAFGTYNDTIATIITETLYLSNYTFDKYKTKKDDSEEDEEVIDINLIFNSDEDYHGFINKGEILAKATNEARELVNEPANIIYPESLGERVIELSEKYGFDVNVYDEDYIYDNDMHAYMAVAKGSSNPPRLIVMEYNGDPENHEVIGYVGKGLTYDSGGYSIKPTDGMANMKTDMGGAAAVIGAMCAIANMQLKVNVVGVIAACENLISGDAYKPGDIIDSMAGKTIYVGNTDAEGRLTLIDAIHYVIENHTPCCVIDIATLTGAALHTLGTVSTPVISNNDNVMDLLNEASVESDDKIWQMPIYDEYKELLKAKEADLTNIAGKPGTITAGLFLGEFVQDRPWAHLDIAGTSYNDKATDYMDRGATGSGARLLYRYAELKSQ